MNLQIRGHLMTRHIRAISVQKPDRLFILFKEKCHFGLEYIEFSIQELTSASTLDHVFNELLDIFK